MKFCIWNFFFRNVFTNKIICVSVRRKVFFYSWFQTVKKAGSMEQITLYTYLLNYSD